MLEEIGACPTVHVVALTVFVRLQISVSVNKDMWSNLKEAMFVLKSKPKLSVMTIGVIVL